MPSGSLLVYGGGGGSSGTTSLNDAFLYNTSGQNSNDASSMLTSRRQFASAPDGTSQAYAIGGVSSQGTNLATVERYNPSTRRWSTVASLPASRSGDAAAFDGSGAIYVVGGSATVNASTGTNTLYKYTVATNSWTTLANLPLNLRDAAAVFSPDGELQVIGGISNGQVVASVETYDPSTNTWTTNNSLPAPVRSAVAVDDSFGRVEVIGGFNASGTAISTVEVSQIVTQPTMSPAFTTTPPSSSLTVSDGSTFTYSAAASGNPLANYSLVSGPAGATIDPVNGALSWVSPASLLGSVPVTIKASNLLGSVTQSFTLNVVDKTAPTLPGAPVLTGEGTNSLTLSWAPSTDNIGVTGYSVYWIYTVGHSGRGGGSTTYTVLMATTNGSTTSATLSGLTQNKSYSFYVQANDAAGNKSGYSGPLNAVPGASPSIVGLTTISSTPSPTAPLYTLSDVANHQWTLQIQANSFATVTYSVVNPPAGMTVNPTTGLVSWTPNASELGTTSVTFQATNQFGFSSVTYSMYVSADLPVPGFVFTNTSSPTLNVVGFPIGLQITDASNTPSTYSVVSGPSNLSIDPTTGVVNWIPTPAQAGGDALTVQLTNSFGTSQITVNPVIYITDAPGNLAITGTNGWSPTVTWTAPLYNDNLIAGYRIMLSGGGGLNENYTISGAVTSTSLWLSDNPGSYIFNIQSLDANGSQGLWTSFSFNYNPVLPYPIDTINSNGGAAIGIVGQPVSIQLGDLFSQTPTTYARSFGPGRDDRRPGNRPGDLDADPIPARHAGHGLPRHERRRVGRPAADVHRLRLR